MKLNRDVDNTKKNSLGGTLIERIANKVQKTPNTNNVTKKVELSKSTPASAATEHTKPTPVSGETLKENLVVSSLKHHPSSDTFNILRTKVLSKMRENNWRVLAVTSPKENAGKSFTAVNLAVSIAMEEKHSALLVDFDFRRPSILGYFGIKSKKGLSDYFSDNSSLSSILIRPEVKKPVSLSSDLVLLPAGDNKSGSAELLSSSKLINLVRELKNRYSDRIIIVDLPPLLDTADAMTFLNSADSCLLVVAEGESTVDNIKQSMRLIDEKKLVGSVFNKSTGHKNSMYY